MAEQGQRGVRVGPLGRNELKKEKKIYIKSKWKETKSLDERKRGPALKEERKGRAPARGVKRISQEAV
jgi:hypothetical protein